MALFSKVREYTRTSSSTRESTTLPGPTQFCKPHLPLMASEFPLLLVDSAGGGDTEQYDFFHEKLNKNNDPVRSPGPQRLNPVGLKSADLWIPLA